MELQSNKQKIILLLKVAGTTGYPYIIIIKLSPTLFSVQNSILGGLQMQIWKPKQQQKLLEDNIGYCCHLLWNYYVPSPLKSICWNINPNAMPLTGGAFER